MNAELLKSPLLQNDTIVFGLLMATLGIIFYTSSIKKGFWGKFYSLIPALLLCYFIPSIFTSLGIISPEWINIDELMGYLKSQNLNPPADLSAKEMKQFLDSKNIAREDLSHLINKSQLYYMASRYLLPASLVLLTLSIDFKEMAKLGPKALIMFFTATVGVVIGGPLAIIIVSTFAPEVFDGEIWRGMSTVAGSWIGGGANQAAMFEIFHPSGKLYSVMIAVDVVVAEIWMFFLLLGVGKSDQLDRFFKADNTSIKELQKKMEAYSLSIARIAKSTDFFIMLGLAFGAVGLSHLLANNIAPFIEVNFPDLKQFSLNSSFFWLIVLTTTIGIGLSFTKARNFEGAGASKIGSVFIYVLVATIGMKMDIRAIFEYPELFLVGSLWMLIHILLLFIVGKIIRSPYFFLAVGSKANIGGAASAPVVAAAFHPSLIPVGVLLAVLGYALGTYGALLCGNLMQMVSP